MSWSYPPGMPLRLATLADVSTKGDQVILANVNINKAVAGAVVDVYSGPFPGGTPSTTGTKVASIDAGGTNRTLTYNIRCQGGLYAAQTVAAADVTICVI